MTLLVRATWTLPIILACASFCLAISNVTYEWKYIEYVQETCIDQKGYSISMGSYDYTKNIPTDIQPLADGRVLVTTPRYFNNPASLSTISDQTGDGGPLLAPYPDWTWHNRRDCSGITSVSRVFLDECNRLWLVDSGKIGNHQVCPAKILAFDPENDELMTELVIPDELTHSPNNQSQGRVEVSGVETCGESCEKTWVYIADPEGFGLVIWDGYDIWRLNDEVFYPDPNQTIFNIAGENFTLSIGISSMFITPEGFLKDRAMIFKSLSAINGCAVSLEELHNSKYGTSITYYQPEFLEPSQELAGAYAPKGGILIISFATETVLACWNLQSPVGAESVAFVEVNETTLQFVSAVKITEDEKSGSQTLWVLSNRLQRFMSGTMDWDEINFRILTADLLVFVNGTACEPVEEYDVVYNMVDKGFLYLKTETDDLFASYPLHDNTDTLGGECVHEPVRKCNVEDSIEDKVFLYHETPTDARSKSCRLVRI